MVNRYVKYFLCLLFCLFVCPLITHAACDYQRMAELSKIASNVQFSYSYEVNMEASFDVYITNITNDIYVVDNYDNVFSGTSDITKHYSGEDNSEFSSGSTITYTIYSNDLNCKDEKLTAHYIIFPTYNQYQNTEVCHNNPDFKYCGLWENTRAVDDLDFYEEYQKYVNKNVSDNNIGSNDNSFLNKIYNFIISNVVWILLLFIVMMLLIIIFRKIKKKREIV